MSGELKGEGKVQGMNENGEVDERQKSDDEEEQKIREW